MTSQTQAGVAAITLEQAPLAYPPEALEPHIDAMTMNIHYGKHHASYIANLSKALEAAKIETSNVAELITDLSKVPADAMVAIRNNGGGHVNHTWFWQWMAPRAVARLALKASWAQISRALSAVWMILKSCSLRLAASVSAQAGPG